MLSAPPASATAVRHSLGRSSAWRSNRRPGALAALGKRFPAVSSDDGDGRCAPLIRADAGSTNVSATTPAFVGLIADDPRPVRVLQPPFGVRDGTFTAGNFSARYPSTNHGSVLLAAYLSRISQKRVHDLRSQPTLDALITMSEKGTVNPGSRRASARSRFIEIGHVGT